MYYRWAPYIPVARRRAQAKQKMAKLRKKGVNISPIEIQGRKIAHTFWGQAWCKHLECFSDFDNRLPRGRTYVRNGSVCHLELTKGKVKAIVSGSSLYNIEVSIKTLDKRKWADVKKRCAGQIGSLLELLQGKLSDKVMAIVTDPKDGLFPLEKQITFNCDCPDWAYMCKHVAAVLYGVAARLDEQPDLLFLLRGVDHTQLITATSDAAKTITTKQATSKRRILDEESLSDVFGIDLAPAPGPGVGNLAEKGTTSSRATSAARKKRAAKKTSVKKAKKKAVTRKSARVAVSRGTKKAKLAKRAKKESTKKIAKKAITTATRKATPKAKRTAKRR